MISWQFTRKALPFVTIRYFPSLYLFVIFPDFFNRFFIRSNSVTVGFFVEVKPHTDLISNYLLRSGFLMLLIVTHALYVALIWQVLLTARWLSMSTTTRDRVPPHEKSTT